MRPIGFPPPNTLIDERPIDDRHRGGADALLGGREIPPRDDGQTNRRKVVGADHGGRCEGVVSTALAVRAHQASSSTSPSGTIEARLAARTPACADTRQCRSVLVTRLHGVDASKSCIHLGDQPASERKPGLTGRRALRPMKTPAVMTSVTDNAIARHERLVSGIPAAAASFEPARTASAHSQALAATSARPAPG